MNHPPLKLLIAKAEWADKQIADLDRILKANFPNECPDYSIRFEDDFVAGERSYYCESVPLIPIEMNLIAGDILQNLRSALDHLACHLVRFAGNEITSQTCFPIADSPEEYMAKGFRRKVQGMRQEAIDALDAIKPYKTGNNVLWALHKLNNIDKHRLLIAACSTNSARSLTPSERSTLTSYFKASHPNAKVIVDLRGALRQVPAFVPLKAGDKLCTIPHSELEQNMQFRIEIAFDEPKVVECKPILETLNEMSNMVTGILTNFSRDGFL